MTSDEMYEAVIQNDEKYDGVFFYAVKSTGIYCRPSCKSKIPKRENTVFFITSEEAQNAGFRPCKRCRSDLLSYEPAKEIAIKAKKIIDDFFISKQEMNDQLKELGMSKHQLVEIFKQEYDVTPKGYCDKLRLDEIKRLLSETKDDIADIAYEVGFGSISSFYRFFKNQTGKSPNAYRKESISGKNSVL